MDPKAMLGQARSKMESLFKGNSGKPFIAPLSIDLTAMEAAEVTSRLLVSVDIGRLERANRDRQLPRRIAQGSVEVEPGKVTWTPNALERSCGVAPWTFTWSDLASVDPQAGRVVLTFVDGDRLQLAAPNAKEIYRAMREAGAPRAAEPQRDSEAPSPPTTTDVPKPPRSVTPPKLPHIRRNKSDEPPLIS